MPDIYSMNKQTAEDIYWVLSDKHTFSMTHGKGEEYERLKRLRVKISRRYNELKSTHSFTESERISIVEWLMNLCE